MNPIEELWDDFALNVLRQEQFPGEFRQLRRVFFCGAVGLFWNIHNKLIDAEVSDEDGQAFIKDLKLEAAEFEQELAKNRQWQD